MAMDQDVHTDDMKQGAMWSVSQLLVFGEQNHQRLRNTSAGLPGLAARGYEEQLDVDKK